MYEYHGDVRPSNFPVRPRQVRLGGLGGPFECLGVRAYTIRFRVGRRYFQAHVVARGLSPGTRAQVERALASMTVLAA